MNTYAVKVIMPSGFWIDVTIKAGSWNDACSIALAQHGPGSRIGGCIQIAGW